jgi:hypothetical protein
MGTPEGDRASRAYVLAVREATVELAMLAPLRNLPPCFEDVVFDHFTRHAREILQTVQRWVWGGFRRCFAVL